VTTGGFCAVEEEGLPPGNCQFQLVMVPPVIVVLSEKVTWLQLIVYESAVLIIVGASAYTRKNPQPEEGITCNVTVSTNCGLTMMHEVVWPVDQLYVMPGSLGAQSSTESSPRQNCVVEESVPQEKSQ
jgi:hypothetical protein